MSRSLTLALILLISTDYSLYGSSSADAVYVSFSGLAKDMRKDPAKALSDFIESHNFNPEELAAGLDEAMTHPFEGAPLALLFEVYLFEKTKNDDPRIRAAKALKMSEAGKNIELTNRALPTFLQAQKDARNTYFHKDGMDLDRGSKRRMAKLAKKLGTDASASHIQKRRGLFHLAAITPDEAELAELIRKHPDKNMVNGARWNASKIAKDDVIDALVDVADTPELDLEGAELIRQVHRVPGLKASHRKKIRDKLDKIEKQVGDPKKKQRMNELKQGLDEEQN